MSKSHSSIGRNIGVISFFTLISRVFGLIRDVALAYAFGATFMADAFYVAFRIPNLLRRLVAEGSLTIAFVPTYTDYLRKSKKDAFEVLSIVFTFLSIFLTLLVLAGVLFAPFIVKLIAYGFEDNLVKFNLTIFLTRLMFPYIFLISLVALAMGTLNSLKRFASPAAAPILLNISIILAAVFLKNLFYEPTIAVALGVLIGGVAQLVLQVPFLAKEGMLPRINFNWKHPALKTLGLLMLPSIYGAAVYQLNVLVITLLASFLPDGSVSYLWYADRLSEFPLGIFAIAVATATLPLLSEHASAKDMVSFKKTANYSLRLAFLIDVPAAAGLFILSEPIVRILFQRGAFDMHATHATAMALKMFAIGIPFVSGVRNLIPAFFALKSPKTPVFVATVALIVNALCALILMKPLLHCGLALAMAISSFVNFSLLLFLFRKKIGRIDGTKLIVSILKTIIATLVMSGFLFIIVNYLNLFETVNFVNNLLTLIVLIGISLMLFVIIIRSISPEEYSGLKNMIKRKKKSVIPE